MSTHFGPESPRPISVSTESHLHCLPIDRDPQTKGLFNFGPIYNARFAFELGKVGEINCDDRVVYVGPNRGSVLPQLRSELSLIHPPLHLVPQSVLLNSDEKLEEHEDYEEWRVNCSAEEFFRVWTEKTGPRFDRIVICNTDGMLKDPVAFYNESMRTLEPRCGKLILIQRPIPLTSLPFRTPAVMEILQDSPTVASILQEFSVPGHDVEWEIVRIPILMSKTKWLSMIHHRFPAEMANFSDSQIAEALRELVDGPFKYCGNSFECEDALVIACMSKVFEKEGMEYRRAITSSNVGRHKGAAHDICRSVELSNGAVAPRGPLSPISHQQPVDRFPLVQKCTVDYGHNMDQIYRV